MLVGTIASDKYWSNIASSGQIVGRHPWIGKGPVVVKTIGPIVVKIPKQVGAVCGSLQLHPDREGERGVERGDERKRENPGEGNYTPRHGEA